jgi:hypothetical protein
MALSARHSALELKMGCAKEAMLKREEGLGSAVDYLISVGKLESCELHDEIYSDGSQCLEPEFWASAMTERKRGKNGSIPWASDLADQYFIGLIEEAYERNIGDSCGQCDRNENS